METKTRPSYEVKLKVAFYDLDPLQIVWHGNYLKYFDVARGELFDHLGVDLFDFHRKTNLIFPIIRTSVKHIRPLKWGDEFICRATVKEARTKIVVAFEIRLVKDGILCARGETEQVAVRVPEMEMAFSIPEDICRSLGG
ncbi:MAG: thioesterase family protein [Deltaproteobacteria bacterium]|nr:thioesterase family protein [Deltaproteobacteria bacterium]